MDACIKLGGDPTLGHEISVHNYQVPFDFLTQLKQFFPKIEPSVIKDERELKDALCSVCQFSALPTRGTIVKTLAMTHIHSSLELDSREIFLMNRDCAKKIKEFIEENFVKK